MIVEVLVSAVLLIVLALAAIAIIDRSQAASAMNRARSTATALAQQEQDRIRQMPWSQISGIITPGETGTVSVSVPNASPTIDLRQYSVKTDLSVVPDSNNNTACLADWKKAKIKIVTTVTPLGGDWRKDVTLTTYRVPLISDSPGTGSVIVRLTRADGSPAGNVPVNVTGKPQQLTSTEDGCAVVNDITPGSKTITWGAPAGSMVDENGARSVTRVMDVMAGKTIQLAGRFDNGVALTGQFKDENGNPAQWNSLTVTQSGVSTVYNGIRSFPPVNAPSRPIVASITTDLLFPFKTPYAINAGTCWGNNADIWAGTPSSDNSVIATTSGSVDVLMPTVTATISPAAAGWRMYVRYDRQPTQMGAGRCDIWDGIFPAGSSHASSAPQPGPSAIVAGVSKIVVALPYGRFVSCFDNSGLGKRVKAPPVFNNTPAGTPAPFAPSRVQTIDVSAPKLENGACLGWYEF